MEPVAFNEICDLALESAQLLRVEITKTCRKHFFYFAVYFKSTKLQLREHSHSDFS